MAYLSEVLKQGIEVKIKEDLSLNQLVIEGEPICGIIDIEPFNPQNNKIKLPTKIFAEETNFKKVDAILEFLVQGINKNQVTLLPLHVVNLDENEIDVNSSAVEFINYLPQVQALIVSFWDQGAYVYYDVPPSLYALMVASESKGKAYHQYIKYRFTEESVDKAATVEDVNEMAQRQQTRQKQEKRIKVLQEFIQSTTNADKLYTLFFSDKVLSEVKPLFIDNENSPEEVLTALFSQVKNKDQEKILKHKNVSIELLETSSRSAELAHRKAVAENLKSPLYLLEALLKDNSSEVRNTALVNPKLPEELKESYKKKGLLRGFLKLPQWYLDVANISVLENPKNLTIDENSPIDLTLHLKQPKPLKGEIVMRVEGDGTLTLVDQNFDSNG